MPEQPEYLRKTLDDFKKQLTAQMSEVGRVLSVVNAIEEKLGVPKTSLSGVGATWNHSVGDERHVSESSPSPVNIRPDEFLGDKPREAAKKYLRRIRRAAHLDEIAEAISKGGAAARGADWKDELGRSLLRSTREVVKVNESTYGLVEFYTDEQLRGLRATRRQRPEPTRKRGRPKKRASRRGQRETTTEHSDQQES